MSRQHPRTFLAVAAVTALALTVSACAQGSNATATGSAGPDTTGSTAGSSDTSSVSESAQGGSSTNQGSDKKVILIGDQAFGDHGPMDDMAAALEGCSANQGFQTKKIVALSPSEYQSSINAAAKQGYDMIITTFPQMTDATVTAAKANPNIKFAAVYQFINDQGQTNVTNVWSTSFDVNGAAYAQGILATKLSTSKKLGFIVGDMDPTIAGELNAFIQGAKKTDPSAQVLWANANTFSDPAKGKDLAQGMIAKGVDVLSTAAAQTQLGALDAAKSAGILFFGDNGDNSATYPKGFVSDLRSELGVNVTDACEKLAAGSFPGGTQTVYNLANKGADVDTALITKWGEASGRSDDATALVKLYDETVQGIDDGSITVANDTNAPKS